MSSATEQLPKSLTMRELASLLVKHYDIHEGLYEASVNFQITVGGVGPSPEEKTPGVVLGIFGVGLAPTPNTPDTPMHNTVDAAEINPIKAAKPATARKK